MLEPSSRRQGPRERRRIQNRLAIVTTEAINDLGFTQWRAKKCAGAWAMLLLCVWIRIFLHFFAQLFALRLLNLAVFSVDIRPYHVLISYSDANASLGSQLAVTAAGPVMLTAMFVFLAAILVAFQTALQATFVHANRLVVCFGIAAWLDPLLVALIDLCLWNFPAADMAKVAHAIAATERSQVTGGLITFVLYAGLAFGHGVLFYVFMNTVYMGGRIADLIRRLFCPENTFYVPLDAQMSPRELRDILSRIERWRGKNGACRRAVVTDFAVTSRSG